MLNNYDTTKTIHKDIIKTYILIGGRIFEGETFYPQPHNYTQACDEAREWCEQTAKHFKKGAVRFRIDYITNISASEYLK